MTDRFGKARFDSLLEKHFIACAAIAASAAVVGATAGDADAAIHYSGLQNLNVPGNNSLGVYVNMVTNASGANGSSTAGWDVNPYIGQSSGRFRVYMPATSLGVSAAVVAGEVSGGAPACRGNHRRLTVTG